MSHKCFFYDYACVKTHHDSTCSLYSSYCFNCKECEMPGTVCLAPSSLLALLIAFIYHWLMLLEPRCFHMNFCTPTSTLWLRLRCQALVSSQLTSLVVKDGVGLVCQLWLSCGCKSCALWKVLDWHLQSRRKLELAYLWLNAVIWKEGKTIIDFCFLVASVLFVFF